MKKTYKNPTLTVVKVQPAQFIAMSYTDTTTSLTGGNHGRGAGFSDSDDWED